MAMNLGVIEVIEDEHAQCIASLRTHVCVMSEVRERLVGLDSLTPVHIDIERRGFDSTEAFIASTLADKARTLAQVELGRVETRLVTLDQLLERALAREDTLEPLSLSDFEIAMAEFETTFDLLDALLAMTEHWSRAPTDIEALIAQALSTAQTASQVFFAPLHVLCLHPQFDMSPHDWTSELHAACTCGFASIVQFLTSPCMLKHVDLNAYNKLGYIHTALTLAAHEGHPDIVSILLKQGADVNKTTTSGRNTALMLACKKGHVAVVKVLLTQSHAQAIDYNVSDRILQHTALMLACLCKDGMAAVQIIQLLMTHASARLDWNASDSSGMTALMHACNDEASTTSTSTCIIAALLSAPAELLDVNIQDGNGYTALMRAIAHEHSPTLENIVALFLALPESRVDLGLVDTMHGQTAFMVACTRTQRNARIVNLMLTVDPGRLNLGARDSYGTTTLMRLCAYNLTDATRILAPLPVVLQDINATTTTGSTALNLSFTSSTDYTTALFLLTDPVTESRIDLRTRSTMLRQACIYGVADIVEALFARPRPSERLDIHAKDLSGRSPYMFALLLPQALSSQIIEIFKRFVPMDMLRT